MINRNLIQKLSPIFSVTSIFLLWNPITEALPSRDSLCIQPKVIYGVDNRQEYYEIKDPLVMELADSTLALVDRGQLQNLPGAKYKLGGRQYGSAYGLCTTEPYFNQKISAFCTGFLVAPNLVATAGHCVRSQEECQNTQLVFGFALRGPEAQDDIFDDQQVYSCVELIKSEIANSGADYAVIRIDRKAIGRSSLELRTQGELSLGDEVFVVGHPSGLPVKIAGGARVRAINGEFYVANLDTYGGNSGSPVFNSKTGQVEGILVRGETDYISKNGCNISNSCTNDGCRGEDFTKIRHVVDAIK